MSAFDQQKVRELAQIQVQPSRGHRQGIRPFDDEPALGRALKRAENAYHKSLERQCILDHYLQLQSVFEEQRRFSRQYDKMVRAWKDMTDLGKGDIAATADYFLAIKEHGEDENVPSEMWLEFGLARSPETRRYRFRLQGQSAFQWALWRASANHPPCAC